MRSRKRPTAYVQMVLIAGVNYVRVISIFRRVRATEPRASLPATAITPLLAFAENEYGIAN